MNENVIGNFKKLRRLFCDDALASKHESGEWQLEKETVLYKEYVKRCIKCGKITSREIMK